MIPLLLPAGRVAVRAERAGRHGLVGDRHVGVLTAPRLWWVHDGRHRVIAAIIAGRTHIEAVYPDDPSSPPEDTT